MKQIQVYEPAMCCATGLCGAGVDPELLRISTLLTTLAKQGGEIERFNLTSNPQAFVSNAVINDLLMKGSAVLLPITLLDGEIIKTKAYPSNQEIYAWLGIEPVLTMASAIKSTNSCCGGSGCC